MNLLEQLAADDHEQVIAFQNRAAGLRGFLAIHDTTLGPALGGVVNEQTLPKLRVRVVCGSANNVLASPEAGDELVRRGILYAPDYLVNAGGLIRGAEFDLLKRADSSESIARIYERMRKVLTLAQERGVSTARVADELAEARLKKGKTYRDLYWGAPTAKPETPTCES